MSLVKSSTHQQHAFENTLDLTLSRDLGFKIFRLLPLVDSSDIVKNLSISTRLVINMYNIRT